ncbi:YybH family protein [Nocardia vermiculata]|uniref:SnoaL-like domain-containing protein n=1 Tax=Nocardia vermiculata TaxID=257274 RepID=A0A846XWS3_9NOCA|nr:nuclear transport factor 2 family protein [Nocardia vermiculata]NKY49528.1 SnoaL-like domain-containing protein [Nocardia vermiculata]
MTTPIDSRPQADRGEPEEIRIRRRLDLLIDALRARNLDALRALYTVDVVSFDVEPPLQHSGIAAKLENWAKVFLVFDTVNYEIRELTVTVGGDVAFAHAFARLYGTLADGTTTDGMWVRATFGLRKIDHTWLIAHDQVSVPFDMATGRGVLDLVP